MAARKRKGDGSGLIRVTDHAICRFFERALGYSRAQLEEMVLPAEERDGLVPDGIYPTSAGHQVRVLNNTVVTVLPAGGRPGDAR